MSAAEGSRAGWDIITCEYPPQVGGVSDYTLILASTLALTRPVRVWCPGTDGTAPEVAGVDVRPLFGTFTPAHLQCVGALLDRMPAPRHLLVQWVPQGFGQRSLNLAFAAWLAWRARFRGDVVHLMVHEPFLPWSARPKAFVAALVHRLMLGVAARWADRVWVSTDAWAAMVTPYLRKRTPVQWLPVCAAELSTAQVPPHTARTLVGHFGTHTPHVTAMLALALDVVLQQPGVDVLLIGRGSDLFRTRFLETRPQHAERVHATGTLTPSAVPNHLARCTVMLQPYPDGVTTRRTSTLGLLSAGLPVVTNAGALTEPVWHEWDAVHLAPSPDPALIGRSVLTLLADDAARLTLGRRARALYERCFKPARAASLLEAAAWPHSDAA